jgi:hypothetical protein
MDWIAKVIPFLEQYPMWVRWLSVGWIVFSASLIGVLIVARDHAAAPSGRTVETGDNVIDDAEKQLAKLIAANNPPPEAKVVEALAPLFSRPAFYGIREENWSYFLFTLCKTRLLLEQHVKYLKSSPQVRSDLGRAIELMVRLQNDVATVYSPTFSITDHIRHFIHSRDEFTRNLPPLVREPNVEFFDARDRTIREIRTILKPIGLVAF